ncbi:MAG: GNAT family N-acetyltransferase [Clostridiales bacterium]|nr:GNAT family N-acetyltransferase [Clostridiales bacterium]
MIQVIEERDFKLCYQMMIESFLVVADTIGATPENCPGNSAFLEYGTFLNAIEKGLVLYGYYAPELVGCIGLDQKSEKRHKIKYLCVSIHHQQQGYGKALMDHVESLVEGKIQLGMINENIILRTWYESLGYKIDKVKSYKKNKFTVAFMEKQLDENI